MTSRAGTDARGYSYVEILVAISLIAVALVPAVDALRAGVSATTLQEIRVQRHYAMLGRMERVLAEPFPALEAAGAAAGHWKNPTSYSDAAGSDPRLLVFIGGYDLDDADNDDDPFTGPDDGVLWVRVAVEGTLQELETLVVSE